VRWVQVLATSTNIHVILHEHPADSRHDVCSVACAVTASDLPARYALGSEQVTVSSSEEEDGRVDGSRASNERETAPVASREEALEGFRATPDDPRSRARARLWHIMVSQDAHEVGEGTRARQAACDLQHSSTAGRQKLPDRHPYPAPGVHKAHILHHPARKVHVYIRPTARYSTG
jgi:hypothetical protein